ncbi:MAG: hypothetical protein M1822_002584 [Bathelium mastoideum]|nr:MAG: hypothetical protein M1822_002584 [Bathelium mastoideum]
MSNTTIGVAVCALLTLGLLGYCALLPKPIPGIPYNKASTKRILGDAPDVMKWKEETGEIWSYIRKLAIELDSPIIQMFMRPYAKPWVIINDFRESLDIQIYRSNEFDRGGFLGDIFKPLLPGNHVWMPTNDQFRANRQLMRDTMSPTFLHRIIGPRIHSSAQSMLALWHERARLARGHPFEVEHDVFRATVDVILSAAFGFEIGAIKTQTALLSSLAASEVPLPRDSSSSSSNTKNPDLPATFPVVEDPEDFRAIRTITDSVEIALNSPLPRLSLGLALRVLPRLRRAKRYKDRLLSERLRLAWQKFVADDDGADGNAEVACAVDLLVQREAQMARREQRAIQHDTPAIRDELFGFLQAGHETGSTTICWAVKYLTVHGAVQRELRAELRRMHSRASEEARLPNAEEIAATSVPFLDAFIEETHRLCTTSSAVVRVAVKDTTVLGHAVPKGSDVFMLMNGPGYQTKGLRVDEHLRSKTSRDAKDKYGVWDERNVEQFVPERWLVKNERGEKRFDPFAGPANPYGKGLRSCFGTKLAVLELKIFVTLIVWTFEFHELPPVLADLKGNDKNTHRPQHVYVRLKEVT